MSVISIIITIVLYFVAIFLVSRLSARRGNGAFFNGGRSSGWFQVAFAMIGAAMSGVTYVSVPGMVGVSGLGYLQMCIGFVLGYLVIAYLLIPLFYRLNVVSIYQYLENRFGVSSYKTGALFFFISKMLGASVRLFLVCLTLQLLVFEPLGLPFWINVLISVAIALAYTFRGGVSSLIGTDTLKTICMIVSVVLCIVFIAKGLSLNFGGLVSTISDSGMSRIFYFDDINHPQYFFKQVLGGLFTVVAMTGLDQDMMQRTLSCKDYRSSQKNLIVSIFMQVIVIFMFLCLGVLLYTFASANGITETGDKLFPAVATSGYLPPIVGILFIIGLVSSAYGAAGSALTALTTSFTVDILGIKGKSEEDITKTRKTVHIAMAVLMAVVIVVFNSLNSTSAIDAVYKLASYTYGPILGMFLFGICCKRKVRDKWVPLVAILAPCICLILQLNSETWFAGYRFSYELLPLNALLTILGLCCLVKR